jgi:hypothetical protein
MSESLNYLKEELILTQKNLDNTTAQGRKKSFKMSRFQSGKLRDDFMKGNKKVALLKSQIESHPDNKAA